MNADQAKEHVSDMCKSLVSKGRLLLTVDVRTEEEAEQILEWMYCKEKPMKALLNEIAWDKVVVDDPFRPKQPDGYTNR
jgi:hypothetical protein